MRSPSARQHSLITRPAAPRLQTVAAPAMAASLPQGNTERLGAATRDVEADLQAIIKARTGTSRALPKLTSSPASQVQAHGRGTLTHDLHTPHALDPQNLHALWVCRS